MPHRQGDTQEWPRTPKPIACLRPLRNLCVLSFGLAVSINHRFKTVKCLQAITIIRAGRTVFACAARRKRQQLSGLMCPTTPGAAARPRTATFPTHGRRRPFAGLNGQNRRRLALRPRCTGKPHEPSAPVPEPRQPAGAVAAGVAPSAATGERHQRRRHRHHRGAPRRRDFTQERRADRRRAAARQGGTAWRLATTNGRWQYDALNSAERRGAAVGRRLVPALRAAAGADFLRQPGAADRRRPTRSSAAPPPMRFARSAATGTRMRPARCSRQLGGRAARRALVRRTTAPPSGIASSLEKPPPTAFRTGARRFRPADHAPSRCWCCSRC